jgi:uncharacterized protein with NRDE domain
LLLGVAAHPDYPLVVAANRDELYQRDAEPAGFWPDAPHVLGGRDRQAGGTWLAVTTGGRFAAVTNVRDLSMPAPAHAPSRGFLTTRFVCGDHDPHDYVAAVSARGAAYAGFNLVVGTASELWHCDNGRAGRGPTRLGAGVHAVSNASLDTPWPKSRRGGAELAALLAQPALDPEDLLALLGDRSLAPDEALPDTGVGRELERRLSAVFVAPVPFEQGMYGTRCSTALLIRRDGEGVLVERSFDAEGRPGGTARVLFRAGTDVPAALAGP